MTLYRSCLLLLVLVLAGGSCGCATQNSAGMGADLGSRKIRAVTTVGMITDIVQIVGGDRLEVAGLMGAGVDPHLYKASEGDVGRMRAADVVFYNGLHLEGKMGDVFKSMPSSIRAVAVTSYLKESDLRPAPAGFEGGLHDPHVWFDVSLWMKAVECVRDTLADMDPQHRQAYWENAGNYLGALTQLHEEVKMKAATIPERQRVLVTAHDAFYYFGHAYGFEVRGLQGISTDSEAGVAEVRILAEFIVERKIPALFVESSVPKRNIEAVQKAVEAKKFQVEIGGELYSDAMGNPGTPEGTYIGMVRHNIDIIAHALKPRS